MDGWKGAWCLPLELVEVHLYLYPEQNGLWCVNANTNSDSAYFFFICCLTPHKVFPRSIQANAYLALRVRNFASHKQETLIKGVLRIDKRRSERSTGTIFHWKLFSSRESGSNPPVRTRSARYAFA